MRGLMSDDASLWIGPMGGSSNGLSRCSRTLYATNLSGFFAASDPDEEEWADTELLEIVCGEWAASLPPVLLPPLRALPPPTLDSLLGLRVMNLEMVGAPATVDWSEG